MSWDAYLIDDRGHEEGDWNYTFNTSPMANAALDESGFVRPPSTRACSGLPMVDGHLTHYPNGHGQLTWWDCLNGLSGPEGAALLHRIITGINADLPRFRGMNPENGWGDADSFVKILTDMRDAVPEWPTTWSVNG